MSANSKKLHNPHAASLTPIWEQQLGKTIQKSQSMPDPRYGGSPYDRKINDHIRNGIINLNKPPGPTSHEVVAWIKQILSLEKAGHSGTLDPDVTGVLPVALGPATKALQGLLGSAKEYISVMTLHHPVDSQELTRVTQNFLGEIYQRPPVRSSVKRRMRSRFIYYIRILEYKEPHVLLQVGCQAGTYIRKLCSDIGEALGVGAHMKELRRTRTGPFTEREHHYTLQDLKDAFYYLDHDKNEEQIRQVIRPIEEAFKYMPKIYIRDTAVDAICHGAKLTAPGVVKLTSTIKHDQKVAILTLKDEVVALAISQASSGQIIRKQHGIVALPFRVLMEPNTYPKHEPTI